MSVTLPVWALAAAGAAVAGLCVLFSAALLVLIPTLQKVTTACSEVEVCARAVTVCAGSVVTACDEVEVLARDIRTDWVATRSGVSSALVKPLRETFDSLKQATDPAAEAFAKAQATLVASLAALFAAVATLLIF